MNDFASLTGERLYMKVTSRFSQGNLPWAMVSPSGKRAWEAAASDLLHEADANLYQHVSTQPPQQDKQDAERLNYCYHMVMNKLVSPIMTKEEWLAAIDTDIELIQGRAAGVKGE